MQHSRLPPLRAVHYREKARQLREMANSELSNMLRDQLMNLALQYDHLASSLEAPGTETLQN